MRARQLHRRPSGNGAATYAQTIGIANCTLAYNQRSGLAATVGSASRFANSILWNNGSPPILGTPAVTYSDIQGGWLGTGNIAFNPIFYSPSNFALVDGSPCIDAGNPDFA